MLTMSFVPTGLVFMLLRDPGTEVPGYFHGVPTGRALVMSHDRGPQVPGYFHGVHTGRALGCGCVALVWRVTV